MPLYVPWKFRKFIFLIHENIKVTGKKKFQYLKFERA